MDHVKAKFYALGQAVARRLLKMDLILSPLPDSGHVPGELVETYVPAVDLTMGLDLTESLDSCYAANAVDDVCIAFVRRYLDAIDFLVDVGANQGFYTLLALNESRSVNVVALEPDPYSQRKLVNNLHLNDLDESRLTLIGQAVGESAGASELMLNTAGNRAGSSVIVDQRQFTGTAANTTIAVETCTLEAVITSHVPGPWMLKMDIEGAEYPVLRRFFETAAPDKWPSYVVIEAFGRLIAQTGGSPLELLIAHQYSLIDHDSSNFCLVRRN